MYNRKQLADILFLDIETASLTENYTDLTPRMQALWDKKAAILVRKGEEEKNAAESFTDKAAIYAEFGKVVCISCGFIRYEGETPKFRLKSYCGPDEKSLLTSFAEMVNSFTAKAGRVLCAHNGKEFDFPYLGRRYLVNGLIIPAALQMQGKKPWEVNHIDTMELWKFGDYKSFTSLDLLCALFDVPSPKDDIDGSEVGRVFWKEKDYNRLQKYCENDVLATAQVLLRMSREGLISEANIERT